MDFYCSKRKGFCAQNYFVLLFCLFLTAVSLRSERRGGGGSDCEQDHNCSAHTRKSLDAVQKLLERLLVIYGAFSSLLRLRNARPLNPRTPETDQILGRMTLECDHKLQ
jgi:hypothetical protein